MTVEIVVLAMIAAFLGLRLYSVLGRRAEHEEEPIRGNFDAPRPGAPAAAPAPLDTDRHPLNQALRPREIASAAPEVENGLRDIAAADRLFDTRNFLTGAQAAYGMILEAFWRGDKDELAQLCDSDVYGGFVAAIDARAAAGEVMDNRLVRVERAEITAASYQAPFARVTVRFAADIAAVTRDASGAVIAGSLDDAIEARDIWTFSRNVTSGKPDWLLDETDEA